MIAVIKRMFGLKKKCRDDENIRRAEALEEAERAQQIRERRAEDLERELRLIRKTVEREYGE